MEIKNRRKHDAAARKKLSAMDRRHAAQVKRELGTPPDIRNVSDSTWQQQDQEREDRLRLIVILIFLLAAQQHGLEPEIAGTLAERWGDRRARKVARASGVYIRRRLRHKSSAWIRPTKSRPLPADVTPTTKAEAYADVDEVFDDELSSAISETEITNAQTAGGEAAVKKQGLLSELDTWKTNPHLSASGPCKVCEPLNGKKRSEWEKVVILGPPAHIHCVCEIVYANLPGGSLYELQPSTTFGPVGVHESSKRLTWQQATGPPRQTDKQTAILSRRSKRLPHCATAWNT